MRFTAVRIAFLTLCLSLAACAGIDHNIPSNPIGAGAPADRLTLYADANGHLYPDAWSPRFDRDRIELRHALLASADFDPAVHRFLREERERQLDAVAGRLRDRSRVFILVHGFNNNQPEAREAFEAVRSRLPLDSTDSVIEFHWDGLSSPSRIGQGAMWFNAAGYSQLAGTQALRGLLRRLAGKRIIVIAHSRGASVTLSALSDPAYNSTFRRQTEALLGDDFGSPPLTDGSGAIDLIFLAPAIGNPDFRRPGATGNDCRRDYRDFPRALRSIRYTVNRRDPVLSKIFPPFTHHFNATDLGYDADVGAALADCYAGRFTMVGHPVERPEMPEHTFVHYARHAVLARMLSAAGVGGAP